MYIGNTLFIFQFIRNKEPYGWFYFYRQLYNRKGKFDIRIVIPFIHIYIENKVT